MSVDKEILRLRLAQLAKMRAHGWAGNPVFSEQTITALLDENDALQRQLAEFMSAPIGELFACNTCRCPIHKPVPFQARVKPWMDACFGERISADKQERNHRFLEEALELVQACGATAEEAHQLVNYVYGRPVGEPKQEVGGVMVTLAALCLAQAMDMHSAAEAELTRIWGKVEQIRAKQLAKPAIGPLPRCYPERPRS